MPMCNNCCVGRNISKHAKASTRQATSIKTREKMEKNLVLLHRASEEPEFQVPNPFLKGQQRLFSLALCKVHFFFVLT